MTLVYYKKYEVRSTAIQRENHIKSMKGGNGFKKIIGLL